MATESRSLVVLALIAESVIAVANLDVALDTELSGARVERAIDRIEAAIQAAVPEAKRVFIEMEAVG